MKIVLVTTVVLVSTFSKAWAADGDDVLTGYLVTGSMCLNAAGTGVATPTDLTQANLGGTCIRLLVEETGTASQYRLKKSDAQAEIMVLANSNAPSYDAMGTAIQFSDGTTTLLNPTSTLADITTSNDAVLIQIAGKSGDAASCLTATPDYLDATCGSVEWYFIKADCQVSDCATCNVDATLCDACTAITHVLSGDKKTCQACAAGMSVSTDGTKCVDCSGVTGCDSCSAKGVCGKCTGNLLQNDNASACYDCSSITNCEKCKTDGECSACSSGLAPNAKGDACEATTTEATTASDAGTNTVSVLAIVGMALLTMA